MNKRRRYKAKRKRTAIRMEQRINDIAKAIIDEILAEEAAKCSHVGLPLYLAEDSPF